MLYSMGDWNNQPPFFVNNMIATLGADWKSKISEYLSWFGLSDTPGFDNFLNSNNISESQFQNLIYFVRDNAKNNCP